jgi:threonyl-tRNA synthetase
MYSSSVMRVLQLHCSSFSYEVKKETPIAEQPPNPKAESLENVLVCLTCFEKQDETRMEEITKVYVENIKVDTGRIGTRRVLIHPYAHLSKQLGSPRLAKEFLRKLQETLLADGFEAHRSPFGWYKSFTLTNIGHPLAEAYREY